MRDNHNHGHDEGHGHNEELKKISVSLEEDQIEMLKELASEYKSRLGQRWTLSAMVRVAVGDFLTKMGKMS
ncbi:MAG: hypothetical protein HY954_06845 [Deltaproteobacteria bacterium]|nr:hypothetical protein [Deltaproteobacteria bacterium]